MIEVDEVGTALRYLAQVRADSSMQYASKHAHDHMMHIALAAENERLCGLVANWSDTSQMHEREARRLRGLIEKARGAVDGWCPWCDQYVNGVGDPDKHPDCPAFTPDGEVR